ncbi:MAG: hypothetical protein WD069_03480 [Planctomycetales bacterium]
MVGVQRILRTAARAAASSAAFALLAGSSVFAQERHRDPHGMYQPLNQSAPPGRTAHWFAAAGRIHPIEQQTVRVVLPSSGKVTFFTVDPANPIEVDAPGMVALKLGHVYRLRIAAMPEFPGIELYPSVELIDRLHPPPGQEERFPVPIEFTEEEIEAALDGRMVTKVVYLEQPQLAALRDDDPFIPVQDVSNTINLFAEADLRGRPLVIVRLGSRLPDPVAPGTAFFGTGREVLVPRGR